MGRGILKILFLCCAVLAGVPAQARVFDFKNESVAAYFGGTYGLSKLGQSAFDEAGPASGVTYQGSVTTAYSGELGVLVVLGAVGVRIGAEIFRPQLLNSILAKDAAGTTMFEMTSDVSGYAPVMKLEYGFSREPTYKFFGLLGGGLGTVTLKNEYRFTADGLAYNLANYTEEGSGTGYLAELGCGFEFLMADTTTMAAVIGYRYLVVEPLKHTRDGTTFVGAAGKGQSIKNSDGSDRRLDLSGAYLGILFRFYLKFI